MWNGVHRYLSALCVIHGYGDAAVLTLNRTDGGTPVSGDANGVVTTTITITNTDTSGIAPGVYRRSVMRTLAGVITEAGRGLIVIAQDY